jgi:hypothetical protein
MAEEVTEEQIETDEPLDDFILFEKDILEMSDEERQQAVVQLRAMRLPSSKPKKGRKKTTKLDDGILAALSGGEE